MKKIITLCVLGLSFCTAFAQVQDETNQIFKKENIAVTDTINPRLKIKKYKLWSLNTNGGFNAPVGPFTKDYYSATQDYLVDPNFNHLDFNVRKMFNTKYGLMWVFAYDKFSSAGTSIPFSNNMYSTSIQGVLNVHRALNWEEFTDTFGLQVHFGPGLGFLEGHIVYPSTSKYKKKSFSFDNIYSVISGATVLVKLSDRLALNLDYSMIKNFSHHLNLDGRTNVDLAANRTGIIHTVTGGLTLYVGKKDKHADWYWEFKTDKSDALLARINTLEEQLNDANNNGIPDSWETYIGNKFDSSQTINNVVSGDQNYTYEESLNMINSQYVNVFFDFDQSTISTGTISAINFLIKFLNDNPSANVDVIGYADELGKSDYNLRLSEKRAKNVAEMIVRSGINASRLKVIMKGEDNSVPKESKIARQLVRRVVFKVN